jgi:transcriptional regulator with XRE-family HTH domain
MANELKQAINDAGLYYKEVADKVGYSTGHVSADVSRGRISAEKAVRYSRALGIDPATLRPDVFKPGEVNLK